MLRGRLAGAVRQTQQEKQGTLLFHQHNPSSFPMSFRPMSAYVIPIGGVAEKVALRAANCADVTECHSQVGAPKCLPVDGSKADGRRDSAASCRPGPGAPPPRRPAARRDDRARAVAVEACDRWVARDTSTASVGGAGANLSEWLRKVGEQFGAENG